MAYPSMIDGDFGTAGPPRHSGHTCDPSTVHGHAGGTRPAASVLEHERDFVTTTDVPPLSSLYGREPVGTISTCFNCQNPTIKTTSGAWHAIKPATTAETESAQDPSGLSEPSDGVAICFSCWGPAKTKRVGVWSNDPSITFINIPFEKCPPGTRSACKICRNPVTKTETGLWKFTQPSTKSVTDPTDNTEYFTSALPSGLSSSRGGWTPCFSCNGPVASEIIGLWRKDSTISMDARVMKESLVMASPSTVPAFDSSINGLPTPNVHVPAPAGSSRFSSIWSRTADEDSPGLFAAPETVTGPHTGSLDNNSRDIDMLIKSNAELTQKLEYLTSRLQNLEDCLCPPSNSNPFLEEQDNFNHHKRLALLEGRTIDLYNRYGRICNKLDETVTCLEDINDFTKKAHDEVMSMLDSLHNIAED